MTMGEEGNSSGSESEPSADNLDEDQMAEIVPMKPKKPAPKKNEKKTVIPKKVIILGKKPQSPVGKR